MPGGIRRILSVPLLAQALVVPLSAQDWDVGRFRTNNAWNTALSLEGQRASDSPDQRWYGNDPFDANTGRGSVSYLTFLNNYTDSANLVRNPHRSLIFGGGPVNLSSSPPILPGVTNPTLFRSFAPREGAGGDSLRVAVDFSVIDSIAETGLFTSYPSRDVFAFDLRDSQSGGSLAKFSFRPEAVVQNGVTNRMLGFYWIRNGSDQLPGASSGLTAPWAIAYHALYRLEIFISDSKMDVLLSTLSKAGPSGEPLTVTTFVNSGRLSGANTVANFNTFALSWELSSTSLPPVPGFNYIAVHDVSVTSGVNTWLKKGGVALGTSLTNDSDRNGFTLLEEYAHGATKPGTAIYPPVLRVAGGSGPKFLELAATVRTNDGRLSVLPVAALEIPSFSSSVPLENIRGTSAVPDGFEERVYRLPMAGNNTGFMRLLLNMAP